MITPFCAAFSRLYAEAVGISCIVRNFQDFLSLVRMCQDTDILFFFHPEDFLLNFRYCHDLLPFSFSFSFSQG